MDSEKKENVEPTDTELFRIYIEKRESATAEDRRERAKQIHKYIEIARHVSPEAENVVTIIIETVELECDLDLLQRTTSFFKRGKPGMVFALPARDVSFVSFAIIYKWMSLPNDIVPPKLLMGVYRAARYLEIEVLMKQFDDKIMDPKTACEEVGFYLFYGLHELDIYARNRDALRVQRFFLTMIGTQQFLNLWPRAVLKLFSSSNICVNSEMEVLIAAIIWLDHDYEERQAYAKELFSCIRFDSIPLEALMEFQQSSNPLTQMLFLPEYEVFVNSAQRLNHNTRYCNRRIWIYDAQCEYHHDAHCPKRNFITIEMFMDFQMILRDAPNMHWWNRQRLNPFIHNCRHESCRHLRMHRRQQVYAPQTD